MNTHTSEAENLIRVESPTRPFPTATRRRVGVVASQPLVTAVFQPARADLNGGVPDPSHIRVSPCASVVKPGLRRMSLHTSAATN